VAAVVATMVNVAMVAAVPTTNQKVVVQVAVVINLIHKN
jgi:hypothetical protein